MELSLRAENGIPVHICSGRVVLIIKLNSRQHFIKHLHVWSTEITYLLHSLRHPKCHTLLPLSTAHTYRLGSSYPIQLMSSAFFQTVTSLSSDTHLYLFIRNLRLDTLDVCLENLYIILYIVSSWYVQNKTYFLSCLTLATPFLFLKSQASLKIKR